MKLKIKEYFEKINPSELGLKIKVKVKSISKLGQGTGNLNYLVIANKKKFVFRLNMDPKNKIKSKKEFDALKIAEKYGISPKARYLDNSRKNFESDLIIIDYIEGKTVDKTKTI